MANTGIGRIHPIAKMSPTQRDEAARRYAMGESPKALAAEYGVSPGAITYNANRRGIPSRRDKTGKLTFAQKQEIARRYAAGEKTRVLCAEFGVRHPTILNVSRVRGVTTRSNSQEKRRYELDESAFSAPLSDSAAYWVGFLMADGAVDGNRVRLKLAERDREHVEKFRTFLKTTLPLRLTKPTPTRGQAGQDQYGIEICSDRIAADLACFGVLPRKSFTAQVVGLDSNCDFWRGMIDGDGCIVINRNDYPLIHLVGSRDSMVQFAAFVRSHAPSWQGDLCKSGNIFRVTVSGRNAVIIMALLYSDCAVALTRKHEKTHRIIQSYHINNDR